MVCPSLHHTQLKVFLFFKRQLRQLSLGHGIASKLLRLLADAGAQRLVDLGEHVIGALAGARVGAAQVHSHVVHKVVLLAGRAAEHSPEPVGLDVVVGADLGEQGVGRLAGPLLVGGRGVDGLVRQRAVGARVVGVGAVVAVDGHGAVALEGVEGVERRVDGDLLVVDAEAVAVGVWVREEARLEHRVGRRLDSRDHVAGREGHLLDLGKVVLDVLVERELADAAQGHLALGPDLGQIEHVPAELLGLLWGEHLNVDGPAGELAALDGLEEILGVPVGVLRGHLAGLLVVEGLVALIRLEVDLDVVEGAIRLDKLVSVARVAVHVPIRVGGSAV